jgi:hypothetical protein
MTKRPKLEAVTTASSKGQASMRDREMTSTVCGDWHERIPQTTLSLSNDYSLLRPPSSSPHSLGPTFYFYLFNIHSVSAIKTVIRNRLILIESNPTSMSMWDGTIEQRR